MSDSLCRDPKLIRALTPRLTRYNAPTLLHNAKLVAFLLLMNKEAFYGGAAGGAKTFGLIQAGLQFVDVPGYHGILIRDTYTNMSKEDGLMEQLIKCVKATGQPAKWDAKNNRWRFPTAKGRSSTGGEPASLGVGHMDGPMAHLNYQGPSYHYYGIDEVVGIHDYQYRFLFSRLRKTTALPGLPLRIRAASNPPTREQEAKGAWVRERFVDPKTRKAHIPYIRASMYDNPFLDAISYEESLQELDPVTRAQMKDGNWDIRPAGRFMNRADFVVVEKDEWERLVKQVVRWCRFWDMAATEPLKPGQDPDYTCGAKMGILPDKRCLLAHVLRFRKEPAETERTVMSTIMADGRHVSQRMEQEGGSSGKTVIAYYARLLAGRDFKGEPTRSKSKFQRATPFMNAVGRKEILVPAGEAWLPGFLDNQELFPDGPHDDDTDGASGAYNELTAGILPGIRRG